MRIKVTEIDFKGSEIGIKLIYTDQDYMKIMKDFLAYGRSGNVREMHIENLDLKKE